MTATAWIQTSDYPNSPTPHDLKDFFGIPPSPDTDDSLNQNIRQKRKHWKNKRTKARTDDALKLYDAVLQAIAEAEDFLKRGATIDPGTGGASSSDDAPSRGRARTIDEIWEQIERLLFRNRYEDALARLEEHENDWGSFARFVDLRATVLLAVIQNDPETARRSNTIDRAIADVRKAIDELDPLEARYLTLIELLDAAGRPGEADRTYEQALERLPDPSATFRMRQFTIVARSGNLEPLLRLAIDLVKASADDRALRSEIVQVLVKHVVSTMLPIDSASASTAYSRAIDVAAWCADGVPEAEDFVRPHRMWAANASQPIFAGNWQWRAFFALVTAFVSLPIQNSLQSKPAWQVILKGPPDAESTKNAARIRAKNRAWFMATRNTYIEAVHDDIKLPWQNTPNSWVEIEAVFDF